MKLSDALRTVESPEGRERLQHVLADQPYPHFEPARWKPGLLVRVDEDGRRTVGRFVGRKFTPARRR